MKIPSWFPEVPISISKINPNSDMYNKWTIGSISGSEQWHNIVV